MSNDALIHFPLYIGDTLKKFIEYPTLQERGTWLSIVIGLVNNDGILPDDETIFFKCLIFDEKDKQMLKQMLSKCLSKSKKGWHCDEVSALIIKQKSIRDKRKEAGKKGGKTSKKNKQMLKQSESESESELNTESKAEINNIKTKKNNQDDLFENFWKCYPINNRNKGSKKDALLKFATALKKTNYKNIIDGVKNYENYIRHTGQSNKDASRWLKDECWADEYNIQSFAKQVSRASTKRESMLQALGLEE